MKVIAWLFIAFGCFMLLAAANALYEIAIQKLSGGVAMVVFPALFGLPFLSYGLRLRKKYNK